MLLVAIISYFILSYFRLCEVIIIFLAINGYFTSGC